MILRYEPVDSPLPKVSADSTKLKRILLNLLSNGVKFTPRGGSVTIVTACPTGDWVTLQVRDTGLGLPLAKALTELHGGELKIASTQGGGTTVTILLPVVSMARAKAC